MSTTTKTWRRGWDLNPRYPLRYVRFRGGSFQPLTHLSASDNSDTSNIGPSLYNAQDFGRAPASLTPAERLNFRGGSFQPLTHLSAWKTAVGWWSLACGKPSNGSCLSDYRLSRLARKNDCSNSAHCPASTPPLTSVRWFSCGWFRTCMTEWTAPALGSSAP